MKKIQNKFNFNFQKILNDIKIFETSKRKLNFFSNEEIINKLIEETNLSFNYNNIVNNLNNQINSELSFKSSQNELYNEFDLINEELLIENEKFKIINNELNFYLNLYENKLKKINNLNNSFEIEENKIKENLIFQFNLKNKNLNNEILLKKQKLNDLNNNKNNLNLLINEIKLENENLKRGGDSNEIQKFKDNIFLNLKNTIILMLNLTNNIIEEYYLNKENSKGNLILKNIQIALQKSAENVLNFEEEEEEDL